MTQQTSGEPSTAEAAPRRATIVIDDERPELSDRAERRARRHQAAVEQPEHEGRWVTVPTGSRIRSGPVWAGFVIAFATWVLLELALFAMDLGALAANVVPSADNATWWWSGVAAVVAFLLGGLVAGASTTSEDVSDGVLHGITAWALTVVALIVLSAAGIGIGFGVIGDLLATSSSLAEADGSAISDAQTAAAAALLALTVTLAAAVVGGAIGAKIWPRSNETFTVRGASRKY